MRSSPIEDGAGGRMGVIVICACFLSSAAIASAAAARSGAAVACDTPNQATPMVIAASTTLIRWRVFMDRLPHLLLLLSLSGGLRLRQAGDAQRVSTRTLLVNSTAPPLRATLPHARRPPGRPPDFGYRGPTPGRTV